MERYVKEFYKLSPEEQLEFFGTYGDYRRSTRWIQPLIQKIKLPLCVGITVAGLSISGASASDDVQPRKNLFALPPENVAVDSSKLSRVPTIQPAANFSSQTENKPDSSTTVTTQSIQTEPKTEVVENTMIKPKKEPIQFKQGTARVTSTPKKTYSQPIQVKKQSVSKPQTTVQTTKKKIDFSDIPVDTPSKEEKNDVFLTTNQKLKNKEKVQPFHFHVSKELDHSQIDLTISGTIKEEEPVKIQPYDESPTSDESLPEKETEKSSEEQQTTREESPSTDQQRSEKISEVKYPSDLQLETDEKKKTAIDQKVTKKIKKQTSKLLTHLEQLLEDESIKEIIIKTETKTYLIKEIDHEPTEEQSESADIEESDLTKF